MEKNEQEIEEKSLEVVEANTLKIKGSTIRSVEGIHVDLHNSAVLTIDTERAEVDKTASLVIRGKNLSINQSVGLVCSGENTNLNLSLSPLTISKGETNINKCAVNVVVSKEIVANNTATFLMIGKNISGDITTLLDWRSTLAIGALLGGLWGFFKLFKKRD